MEPYIRELFTTHILQQALNDYHLDLTPVDMLDGFESYIIKVKKENQDFILRIGHTSRRSPDLVQGEAEFLNHLAHGGLSVPKVLPSINDQLVETIPAKDGSQFLATLFENAVGHPPAQDQWRPPLFQAMGSFMGKLHKLSKHFKPSQPRFARFDIEQDFAAMEKTAQKYLGADHMPTLTAYRETVERIRQLPRDQEGYGLCHIDFHGGNFFMTDDGAITLFDFDDCQYAWFIYDIAMALFYVIPHDCKHPQDLENAASFLSLFWSAYQQENDLDPNWLTHIPLFLRLREIDLTLLIHRSMDLSDLDPWCASFMDHRHEKILKSIPYCDLDYAKIANTVKS